MAGRVEQMIARGARSVFERDADHVAALVEEDHLVNASELSIDDLCLRVLARGQSSDADLRFITRAMKMVTDLERIGDLAVNLSERGRDLAAIEGGVPVHAGLERLTDLVRGMVRDAIDAFVDRDAESARSVIARDDEVDELYDRIFFDTVGLMAGPEPRVRSGIHVQAAAKVLERVGDHATNLAEQVIFMVQGADVRHEGKL
jgi:phosphate transport system protein